jgi:hypothetical protein
MAQVTSAASVRGWLSALRAAASYRPAMWWRLTADDRRWLQRVAALTVVLGVAVAALAAWQSARQAQLTELARQASQQAASQQAEALAASQRALQTPGRAWQAGLRAGLPLDAVLSEAHRTALSAGLRLTRAAVATPAAQAASAAVLSADLTVELAGPYPALKIWLRELLARYPSLAVLNLSLRRGAGGDGVEATVVLRLFGAAR